MSSSAVVALAGAAARPCVDSEDVAVPVEPELLEPGDRHVNDLGSTKRCQPTSQLPSSITQVPGGLAFCPVSPACQHMRSSTGTTEGHYHCMLLTDGQQCGWSDSKRNRAVTHAASHLAKEVHGKNIIIMQRPT